VSDKKPFNLEEWQKSAHEFLSHKKWGSSPLEAAEIALRRVDPQLAERCATEAARRKKRYP